MTEETTTSNFIRTIVEEDLANGRYDRVHTRFPPEPNGYPHIGHAKAICASFGIAEDYDGKCNLRFDDTNPTKEEVEYVEAMKRDISWLGFEWDNLYYASDYFGQLYEYAIDLIKKGLAYVDDLSAEEMREYRGTLTKPGKNSPYRDRSVEENLELFERMKNGEFPDGSRVLRAKIDMSSPNINMRDPVMYRILHAHHYRQGDTWKIYPMYDWAHGQSDSIEGISHSMCSLEFEDHRPLYDWFIEKLGIYAPRQIEFARLNLTHTMMSKRKLLKLVEDGIVDGWDDPRMPTISGMRRLGYTPESIRNFCDMIGLSKSNSTIDVGMLEYAVREHLNIITPRVSAVLEPLKVTVTNYPDDKVEYFAVPNYPQDKSNEESREVPFSKNLYIERSDFMENPSRKYYRLAPGKEVRFFGAYYLTCTDVIKDDDGNVIEVHCTYDPESKGGNTPDKRKVKGTIHWVCADHAIDAEVRLYDRLFVTEDPNEGGDYMANVNPESLKVITAKVEPNLKGAKARRFQFMRTGYFAFDDDSTDEHLVLNRTVGLRDSWQKMQKK